MAVFPSGLALPRALLATLALVTAACAAPSASSAEEAEETSDAYTESVTAECLAVTPQGDETVTDARARCLTAAASRILKERPVAQGLASLDSTYELRVDGGSCFTESPPRSPWFTNYDLQSESDVRQMVRQLQYSAEFLGNLHGDAAGYPNRFFKTVAHCPYDLVGGDLVLQGSVLYVGVRTGFRGSIGLKNAFQIRDLWSQGEHLKKAFPMLVPAWKVIDPVGPARLVLRQAVGDAASAVRRALQGFDSKPEHVLRADLTELVRDNVIPTFKGDAEAPLRDTALTRVGAMSGAQLKELAGLWTEFLGARENVEGMTEAVLATHEATAKKAYNVDVVQAGLVVVGNFHDIDVNVSALLPGSRKFSRYVTIEKIEQSIRVRQYAVVAVYTIDNVSVNLAIGAERGLETAGLEHALARVSP